MQEAPKQSEPVRRAFLEAQPPTPFLKTPEGRRIVIVGVLFVIAATLLFVKYRRVEAEIERKAAAAALEKATPTTTVEPAARLAQKRQELGLAFEGAFVDTQNGDDFLETPGYQKLIELLGSATPAQVTERAVNYLDYEAFLREPDLYRGEYVRVRGLLGGMRAWKLDRPVHDITDVWRGVVAQPDGTSESVVFDLIGDPPKVEDQRTVVEVDGLLYRTVSYESRTGAARVAPYMLARNLRVIEKAEVTNSTPRILVTLGGLVVIVGYFFLRASLRGRKRQAVPPQNFKSMLEQRARDHRTQPRL